VQRIKTGECSSKVGPLVPQECTHHTMFRRDMEGESFQERGAQKLGAHQYPGKGLPPPGTRSHSFALTL